MINYRQVFQNIAFAQRRDILGRFREHRYWIKPTSSRIWLLYHIKYAYYRIKRAVTSFLSSLFKLICVYIFFVFILIIGLAFITPQDNAVKNIPDMNIPEIKPVSPDNVLNIVGADGHQIILANNVSARDPSYEELKTFLKADKTDQIPYNYSSFVCADFAETVHNNAEKTGIKAGYAHIAFNEISDTHACNVFNTTDRGLIFIDCTNSLESGGPSNKDYIVTVKEGGAYCPQYLFVSGRWRTVPIGTVKSYEIFW